MAFNAPLHIKRIYFVRQRHPVYSAVTSRAANAFVHMDAVVKVDEIRQIVDACPFERLTSAEAGTDRLQNLRIRPNLRMAAHARLGWRNAGEAGGLYRRMTVSAVNAIVGYMVLVAERNVLVSGDPHACDQGTGIHRIRRPNHTAGNYYDCHNRNLG